MIGLLQSYHAFEILLAIAGILILIDYFFPTDWPAHLGYFCAGAAAFFRVIVPDHVGDEKFLAQPGLVWDLTRSLILGIAIWLILEILHQLIFRRFLTNAPGTIGETVDPEPATN